MIKILYVNKLYYPHIGGIETVVKDMAEGLNSEADIKVLVCQGKKGKCSNEIINGVKVHRCGSLGTYFSMPVSFSFFNKFKEMSADSDIVHIHMPFPLADIGCLMSGFKGKVILSWHSDIVKQKKLMLLYKPFMNRLLKRADKIVVATQGHIDGSDYLKPYVEKCVIIPYGIDLSKYKSTEKNILKCTYKNSKKILFMGRLVYYKGVEVLIKAFETVRNCELFIVGSGKLEEELKKNESDRVHFLGVLSDKDIQSALNDCDIFVLPSCEKSEAFGIVQMEAMAYGKPVINTNLPTGVPFVSLNGQTGITVPVGDSNSLAKAIQTLADNDELRKKYGENGLKRVKNVFSIEKMLESLYNLYENEVEK